MSAWGPLGGYPLASPQAVVSAPAGLPSLTTSTYKPGTLASSGWTPRVTAGSGASCDLCYLAVPAGSTAPTAAQIVAGVDYGAVTVLAAGSVSYTSAGTYDFDSSPATGATESTTYDQWVVASNGTDYGTPVSGEITTLGATLDIDAAAVALSGSLGVSGDIEVGTSFDVDAAAVALSGTLAVSGDIQIGTSHDLAADPIALSGAISASAVLGFSTESTVVSLGGRRKHRALISGEDIRARDLARVQAIVTQVVGVVAMLGELDA